MHCVLHAVRGLCGHVAHLCDQRDVHPGLPTLRHLSQHRLGAHGLLPIQDDEDLGTLPKVHKVAVCRKANAAGVLRVGDLLLQSQDGGDEVPHLGLGLLSLSASHVLHGPRHALEAGGDAPDEPLLEGAGLGAQGDESLQQGVLHLNKFACRGGVEIHGDGARRLGEVLRGRSVGVHGVQYPFNLGRVRRRHRGLREVKAQVEVEGGALRLRGADRRPPRPHAVQLHGGHRRRQLALGRVDRRSQPGLRARARPRAPRHVRDEELHLHQR
mmetsp:Transcript_122110/g.380138  ORF Transcript_122110/g.380138 Transcript_122110/m.380138 type:complete len:270 (+) Transcript_122110:251-1060(+)